MSCPVLLIRTSRPWGVVSSKGPLGGWLCQPVSSPGFLFTSPSSRPLRGELNRNDQKTKCPGSLSVC